METFIFVLEIIGTIAFASSGAMVAIEKKMDIFGVNACAAPLLRWAEVLCVILS